MEITIRKAVPGDAYDFAMCHISCWQTAYRGIVPDDFLRELAGQKQQRIARYAEALENPGTCEYYSVIHDGQMIGWLTINKGPESGEIWAVYLLEAFRGKGFGKQMLAFAINAFRKAGYRQIFLWVFEDNISARGFYKKYGFRPDGTSRAAVYGKPLTQLRYVLSLA